MRKLRRQQETASTFQAFGNSRKLLPFDPEVPETGLSEMYKLFEHLSPSAKHTPFLISR